MPDISPTEDHLINVKMEFVSGAFNMKTGRLVCVQSRKYTSVDLCFKESLNIPFASIRLHDKDRYLDAKEVYDDAVRLAEEICRRWNSFQEEGDPEP